MTGTPRSTLPHYSLFSKWHQKLTSPNGQLFYAILCAFTAFIPVFCGLPSEMEEATVRTSMSSPLFQHSSYAILGLSLASWCDFLLDHLNLAFTWRKTIYMDDKNAVVQVLIPYEKFVLLCAVTVVPIIVLLPPDHPRLVLILSTALNGQLTLLAGFIGAVCSRCYGKYFPKTFTTLAILAFNIVTTITAYLVNHSPSLGMTPREQTIRSGQWGFAALYMIAIIRWLYCEFFLNLFLPRMRYYYTTLLSQTNKSNQENGKKKDEIDWKKIHQDNTAYYPFMYALTALLCLGLLAGVYSFSPFIYDLADKDLLLLNLPVLAYVVSMAILHLQFSKHAIVAYLYALLESKKSYVRYISHELRTPLNTACLGLDMMLREVGHLSTGNAAEDAERLETLSDINNACITSVDILNDLLSFEKMESGILELHLESVAGLPFVKESIAMFTVHARSKGITIVGSFCGYEGDDGGSRGSRGSRSLRSHDMINLDKFKVSQVIRNLMSNALKFTPSGGTVTVKAYFEQSTVAAVAVDATASIRSIGSSLSPILGAMPGIHKGASFRSLLMRRHSRGAHAVSKIHAGGAQSLPQVGGGRGVGGLNHRHVGSVNNQSSGVVDDYVEGVPVLLPVLGGYLVVEVTDSGAGISAENQHKLFKDIVQFNPEKLQAGGGSGLGLWITKGIMELHKGSISVHSEGEGHGCSFTVKLPMQVDQQSEREIQTGSGGGNGGADGGGDGSGGGGGSGVPQRARAVETKVGETKVGETTTATGLVVISAPAEGPAATLPSPSAEPTPGHAPIPAPIPAPTPHPTSQPTPHPTSQPTSHPAPTPSTTLSTTPSTTLRLLVVDDSKMNRKMIVRVMKSYGHQCEEAEDGALAMDVVAQRMQRAAPPYDAILMDFMMPNLDGPGATKAIRAMGYTGKIYGLTGNVLQHDIDHFMSSGADFVLSKPLDINQFHSLMQVKVA